LAVVYDRLSSKLLLVLTRFLSSRFGTWFVVEAIDFTRVLELIAFAKNHLFGLQ